MSKKIVVFMVCTVPFLVSLLSLIWSLNGGEWYTPDWVLLLVLGLELLFPFAALWAMAGIARGKSSIPIAALLPCFLAPTSVLGPWHAGLGLGGFEFFLVWLTKYPDQGPVNLEVLLGILCVLGAGAMPVVFGLYGGLSSRPKGWVLGLIFLCGLIPYIPVVVVLDPTLVQYGVAGVLSWWIQSLSMVEPIALFSPLVRNAAQFSMLFILLFQFAVFRTQARDR